MTVGIIGYGSFGAFLEILTKRFLPDAQIKIHSSRFALGDAKFFSLEEVARCNVVVLAVPIAAYEQTLQKLVPLLGVGSAIVDVATVKVHTVNLLKKYAGDKKYIATHPVFGPESYEKKKGDISGFRI